MRIAEAPALVVWVGLRCSLQIALTPTLSHPLGHCGIGGGSTIRRGLRLCRDRAAQPVAEGVEDLQVPQIAEFRRYPTVGCLLKQQRGPSSRTGLSSSHLSATRPSRSGLTGGCSAQGWVSSIPSLVARARHAAWRQWRKRLAQYAQRYVCRNHLALLGIAVGSIAAGASVAALLRTP